MTKKQNIVQQNRRRRRRGLKDISGCIISGIAAPVKTKKGVTTGRVALGELPKPLRVKDSENKELSP